MQEYLVADGFSLPLSDENRGERPFAPTDVLIDMEKNINLAFFTENC
ncbi:MAG: hypothetical protein ABH870_02160 [bacterium]